MQCLGEARGWRNHANGADNDDHQQWRQRSNRTISISDSSVESIAWSLLRALLCVHSFFSLGASLFLCMPGVSVSSFALMVGSAVMTAFRVHRHAPLRHLQRSRVHIPLSRCAEEQWGSFPRQGPADRPGWSRPVRPDTSSGSLDALPRSNDPGFRR